MTTSRDPPSLHISGKLVIIALRSGGDVNVDTKEINATVFRRRFLFLHGAWLSHSAYDARTVNMAEGIGNHGIPEPRYVINISTVTEPEVDADSTAFSLFFFLLLQSLD